MPVEDDHIRDVLTRVRAIAVVGASPKPERPSHDVMTFLQARGYRILPINPGQAGREILGETVYANLASAPKPVDMVDIFRRSDSVGPVVDEAIAIGARVIWMQIGVVDKHAAERAREAGLTVIMNRCPKIEIARLGL